MRYWVALLCVKDERGIWRHAPLEAEPGLPGLLIERQTTISSPSQRIANSLSQCQQLESYGFTAERIQVISALEPFLSLSGGEQGQLYLCTSSVLEASSMSNWPTIPEMLRSLVAGRNRVAYNKVFQVLAGAATQTLHALDVNEDLRRRLLDKEDPSQN